jgi:hypothetical protein
LKQLIEQYVSDKQRLKMVLPQIISLINAPNKHLENTIILISSMKELKRTALKTGNEHLRCYYINLTRGIVHRMVGNSKTELSWKDALFHTSQKPRMSLSDLTFVGKFHLDIPCSANDFLKFNSEEMQVCAAIGITNADGRQQVADQSKLCLDADFSIGYTGTTVDGIGVYHDISNNRRILKSSQLTAKYITRIVEGYVSPDLLYEEIPLIFSQVKTLIQNHYEGSILESACAVFTKVFYLNKVTCQVITGSVGDCTAFAWNPISKKVVILASARQHDQGPQFNPMSIVDKLDGTKLQRSKTTLPRDAVIFRMTDGAWQMLPNIQSGVLHDHSTQRDYIETVVDIEQLSYLFSNFDEKHPNASEQEYRDLLLTEVISTVNKTKDSIRVLLDAIQKIHLPRCAVVMCADEDVVKFGDFMNWLSQENQETHGMLVLTLNRLEYVITLMGSLPVSELCNTLNNHVDLGDDTLITVQRVSNVAELIDHEEGSQKCNIF